MLELESYARAKCPFYVQEEGCKVTCEGTISRFSHHCFDSKAQRKRFTTAHCAGSYGTCPVYGLLLKKYC